MLQEIILLASILLCTYIALFLLSIKLRDNSIADIFWGVWFMILAVGSYLIYSVWYTSQKYITLLIIFWWVRLTLHILSKKLPYDGKEDARYARWRKQWKYFYIRSFFQVYVFQGFLMLLIALPIFFINLESWYIENMFLTTLWFTIALLWLSYESIADLELWKFMKTKKRWEILTSWLRKYHRYPQYFWESVFWFWISIISLQISIWWFIWWGIITFLLLYVSWVPLLEARYSWNKKYESYSKSVPKFIPNYFLWRNSS